MAKKKRTDKSTTRDEDPPNNPFGALAGLRAELPEGPVEATPAAPGVDDRGRRSSPPRARGRVIVRRERKGHGGKTITLIERAAFDDDELRALKRELGVGARRGDGDVVIVQGDVVDRVETWLAARDVAPTEPDAR